MAGLSFNPEGHHMRDGRTLAEIIADEEYLDSKEPVKEAREKPDKKMKFMSFELDMTYPRTLRGFIRFLQVLLLLVAFVCLLITSWPSQGVYSFYCVFLVLGGVISAALFFSVLAGVKKQTLCGISWVKLELLYFFAFGIFIFIGACLAASNSENNPALNAAAAFGFIACITFALYIFWTWKEYKNPPEEDGDKNEENDPEKSDVESQKDETKSNKGASLRSDKISVIDAPQNEVGDLRIDAPLHHREQKGRTGQFNGTNSGPRPIERTLSNMSRGRLIDPQVRKNNQGSHRRQHSGSDKDSAYSEGSILDGDRSLPTKMRRTASARFDDRRRNGSHGKRHDWEVKDTQNGPNGWHPRSLSVEMLDNLDGRQRKTVPSWLRAAIDCDNESEISPMHASTMPAPRRNEFPLLTLSDEESIAYPSVSQNRGNGEFNHGGRNNQAQAKGFARNAQKGRRQHGQRGRRDGLHNHHGHHRHHRAVRGGPKGGKHFHGHDIRRSGYGKPAMHGQQGGRHAHRCGKQENVHHGYGPHRRRENARVPPNADEFLRRMIENDELVNFNGRGNEKSMPPIAPNGDTMRLYPKQPGSIHFPETSRWDDSEQPALPGEHGNMIGKYLNGQ